MRHVGLVITLAAFVMASEAGAGALFLGGKFPAGPNPWSVAVADLDGDSVPDLVTANFSSADVSVLLGSGDGSFQAAASFATRDRGSQSVVTADLNRDSVPDVVTVNTRNAVNGDEVSVSLGNGDGSFRAAVYFTVGNRPYSVAVADLNGDTAPDLVTANSDSDDVSVLLNQCNPAVRVEIDIKPGSAPNSINPSLEGNLPVAVLGSDDFDVTGVPRYRR
jgi:hypothetical protein